MAEQLSGQTLVQTATQTQERRCSCCNALDCEECGPYRDVTRTEIDDPCRICGHCINHCPHQ